MSRVHVDQRDIMLREVRGREPEMDSDEERPEKGERVRLEEEG